MYYRYGVQYVLVPLTYVVHVKYVHLVGDITSTSLPWSTQRAHATAKLLVCMYSSLHMKQ